MPEGVTSFYEGLGDTLGSVGDTLKSSVGELQGTVKEATETASRIANAPGYGTVFTVDAGGFRLTDLGHLIVGGLAVYGVFQLLSK